MKNTTALFLPLAFLAFLGCSDENRYPTSSDQDRAAIQSFLPKVQGGTCPDIFEQSTKTLSNGAIVTWTSGFSGYDYGKGTNYTVTVGWTVSGGSATFVSFGQKKEGWTPKAVNGTWSINNQTANSIDLTVNMNPMHRVVQPDWQGFIGNGHFVLELKVDGVKTKLGVNIHLEDPDPGFANRCP